ncbi:MAG: DUF4271 domain-containing protein [Bacteroidales bacterium]|nr:DUF4271 domain-containing protein [Bacteroidales bacterium]
MKTDSLSNHVFIVNMFMDSNLSTGNDTLFSINNNFSSNLFLNNRYSRINKDSIKFDSLQKPSTTFFAEHQLKTQLIAPKPHKQNTNDWWVSAIILLCVSIFILIKLVAKKRIKQIFFSTFGQQFFHQLNRDGNLLKERISVALFFIYSLLTSLLIYQTILIFYKNQDELLNSFVLFSFIFTSIIILWALKIIAIKFIAKLFNEYQISTEYRTNILVFNIITGIFLLPLLILIVYLKANIFFYSTFFIIGLLIFFRFFRSMQIAISLKKFPVFYIFLYFCSLEILPAIVIVKLVKMYLI